MAKPMNPEKETGIGGRAKKSEDGEESVTRRWPFQVNLSKEERELIDTVRGHAPMATFIRDTVIERAKALLGPGGRKKK